MFVITHETPCMRPHKAAKGPHKAFLINTQHKLSSLKQSLTFPILLLMTVFCLYQPEFGKRASCGAVSVYEIPT